MTSSDIIYILFYLLILPFKVFIRDKGRLMMNRVVFVLIGSVLFFAQTGICEKINWNTYDEGIQQAASDNKKVFLHFRADWCGYCKLMEQTTFKDQGIIRFLNTHYISIKIDGDVDKKIGKAYKVTGYPDNRFLDEERKQVHRLPGYLDPGRFMFFLEYVESGSYKTMDPMEYYKSR